MQTGLLLKVNNYWYDQAYELFNNPAFQPSFAYRELILLLESKEDKIIKVSYCRDQGDHYIVKFDNLYLTYDLVYCSPEYGDGYYNLIKFEKELEDIEFAQEYKVSLSGYLCPRCENGYSSKWPGYQTCPSCGYPGLRSCKG